MELISSVDDDLILETLGFIKEYLEAASITESTRKSDGSIWLLPVNGERYLIDKVYDDHKTTALIRSIATENNTQVTSKSPNVSGVIPGYGARFEGWVPPVVSKPVFCIRKHLKFLLPLDKYVDDGVITQTQFAYIKNCIQRKRNFCISGECNSGKTTFANSLLGLIALTGDRTLIGEDTREIRFDGKDASFFLSSKYISLRDIVKSMMRLNPDRIIIGELRDGAATLELLKAWLTHGGGITTIHASSPEVALDRFAMLLQEQVTSIPFRLIGETVHVILHICYENGKRFAEVVQVEGYDQTLNNYKYKYIV